MTLTKDDVQVIRKMLREEISLEFEPLKESIRIEFVKNRFLIIELTDRIKNLEIRTMNLEKRIVGIEKAISDLTKEVKKLKKDLKYSINFIDKDYLKLKKQVDAVEAKVRFISA
jgi:uncharacterized coiled-coil protein SlyX